MKQPHREPRFKSGGQRIRDERQRQITVERWTPQHDDTHQHGELELAAGCYEHVGDEIRQGVSPVKVPIHWPWDATWWKPAPTAERNYEKAGALYLAEAERLVRAGKHAEARGMEICAEQVARKLDQPTGNAPAKPKEKK